MAKKANFLKAPSIPAPPDHLKKDATDKWQSVWADLQRRGLADRADGTLVAALCEAYANWKEASIKVAELGQLVKDPKSPLGITENPFLAVRDRASAMIQSLTRSLGLDPIATTTADLWDRFAIVDRARTKSVSPKFSNKQIKAAITAAAGIHTDAARILTETTGIACSPMLLQRAIDNSEDIRLHYIAIKERTLDLAESTLVGEIRGRNLTATIFYLKTKGRDRGYVERQEIGADASTGSAGIIILPAKIETAEAWESKAQAWWAADRQAWQQSQKPAR